MYIYFACLGVCLFVSNKRQNVWTNWVLILCGTSHDLFGYCIVDKEKMLTIEIEDGAMEWPARHVFWSLECMQ